MHARSVANIGMIKPLEKRFADYFTRQPETGMGYWIATAYTNWLNH
jgi:hypothetical protein